MFQRHTPGRSVPPSCTYPTSGQYFIPSHLIYNLVSKLIFQVAIHLDTRSLSTLAALLCSALPSHPFAPISQPTPLPHIPLPAQQSTLLSISPSNPATRVCCIQTSRCLDILSLAAQLGSVNLVLHLITVASRDIVLSSRLQAHSHVMNRTIYSYVHRATEASSQQMGWFGFPTQCPPSELAPWGFIM